MKYSGVLLAAVLIIGVGFGMWAIFTRTTAPEVDTHTSAQDIFGSSTAQQTQSAVQPEQPAQSQTQAVPTTNNKKYMKATLHTTKGNIVIEFLADQAPNTVANFEKLASNGFYNGVKFHRVIPGFMIQGGDPLSKDDSQMARWGTGGPGYTFADEITSTNHNVIGTIAMANAGPNTNGSQFFINVANNNFLDGKHTVFGKVVAGMNAVTAIEHTQAGQNDRPLEPMVIQSVTLE